MSIDEILSEAARGLCSDIFICAGREPRVRRLGQLEKTGSAPTSVQTLDAFRHAHSSPEEERSYKERGALDKAIEIPGGGRFRLNFLQADGLPSMVARPLRFSDGLSFEKLGLPPIMHEFARAPRGLLLITGSAGCGKSTSMAALVNTINHERKAHVVTIEDPVEFLHKDLNSLISQRELGRDCPSFASALKDAMREAPDVIVIGEMRDLETMQAALSAALTGHLVISTLHSPDSVLAVERIVNNFPERLREQAASDFALSLVGVVSQRLLLAADGSGMIPAVEVLKATPHVRNLIAARDFKGLEESMKRGREEGMKTFNRALAELFERGTIGKEAGEAAATNPDEFKLLAAGMESGVDTFMNYDDENSLDKDRLDMRRLLYSAAANKASDLLLTAGESPCVRVNGDVVQLDSAPLSPSDTKRLLYSVLTSRQREILDSERELDFALSLEMDVRDEKTGGVKSVQRRFRINAFFQRGNVSVAIRVVPDTIPDAESLGIPPSVMDLATKRQGLILVTGPTGHGKSTTLACLIDRINATRHCHVITVEDPIEFVHSNKKAVVEQREIHADTKSFSNALKYVLRQDPDVILVGEMRDTETMAAALTAAETGHLVLATLHTNDAPQSIDRIVDSFQAHQQNQIRLQLSASLLCVVSQRLLPRKDGSGRVAAFELLLGSSAVRANIREGKTHMLQSAMETGMRDGMVTMEKALKELYAAGRISREDMGSLLRVDQT